MTDDELDSYLYAQRFYFLAEQSLNIIQKNLARVLRPRGLNHTQHLILLVLRYAELADNDVNSSEIAYLLGMEKHSVTTVVDKLVASDLVMRERSRKDRRVVHLKLSEKGRALSAAAQRETMGAVSVVPDHAKEEFARMCEFLHTLRDHIAENSEQPAEAYRRAYDSLLIAGQSAFRHASREEIGSDDTSADDPSSP